jgi:hypothetical protein
MGCRATREAAERTAVEGEEKGAQGCGTRTGVLRGTIRGSSRRRNGLGWERMGRSGCGTFRLPSFRVFFSSLIPSRPLLLVTSMAVSCSQHVLDNEPLGLYAVKKVAVGDSHDYLAKILKEVKLLQRLRHENIVSPLLEVLEAW